MNTQHKNLARGRWSELTLIEQLANVGSEIFRTISWRQRNADFSKKAFYRGLELLDLTIEDKKNANRLKELLRLREILIDYFIYDNEYHSTDKQWQNYFYAFNWAARL